MVRWHSHCTVQATQKKVQISMKTTCEVIGWLLDTDKAQLLIREENGRISAQMATPGSELGPYAIQTGSFRRGNPIVDPVTRETLGYEMERIASPIALA
jgi:hypothetical protein